MTAPSAAALLSIQNLTKSFFGVRVLHGVGLTLHCGEVLGLVGENGSGKSTTMNIVGGVHQPDGGTMHLDGAPYAPADPKHAIRAGIAFIHQELNLFPNLSIEENLFVDAFPLRGRWMPFIDRAQIRKRTAALLAEVDLELKPSTAVSRLSQGERQLVEIAKALSRNARIIIFDEPTTSLTRPEVTRLFSIIARLKARGIGIIYISHALDDVMEVCDAVTILRDGVLAGAGPRAEMTVPRIVSAMVGRSIDTIYPERVARATQEPVLRIAGLGQPGVVHDIDLTIRAGEIVGLAGLMGSGRSELARIVFGLDPFATGTIHIGQTPLVSPTPQSATAAGVAFLTEDRRGEGLLMDFSISENMVLASLRSFAGPLGILDAGAMRREAASMGRTVHLSTSRVAETQVKHLSGGNQQKVVIGKWLRREPRLFILDEPTRGIDVGAKQEVYRIINALTDRGSAVLLISSEIEELIGLSDRILTIARGELTGEFSRDAFDREAIMTAATGVRRTNATPSEAPTR